MLPQSMSGVLLVLREVLSNTPEKPRRNTQHTRLGVKLRR